jgi:histidinol-phosphatase
MNGPQDWTSLHGGRLSAMHDIATAAGRHTLEYFGRDDLTYDAKADASPVTVADRGAEQLVRKLVKESFPEDTIQGEEFAEQTGTSSYRWVVDPIDGTKSFICGVPLYSTLLALEYDGQPLGGVIFMPALDEIIVAAIGHGSWCRRGSSSWKRASVSQRTSLKEAVFVTSQVNSFDRRDRASTYKQLEAATFIARSWGDGYGYWLVATGRADLMVDPICNAWDVAAILPVIVEAGGRFTDWKGVETVRSGEGLGTNGHLHRAVLDILGNGPSK